MKYMKTLKNPPKSALIFRGEKNPPPPPTHTLHVCLGIYALTQIQNTNLFNNILVIRSAGLI